MDLEERRKEFLEKVKPYEKNKVYTKGFLNHLGEAIEFATTEKKGSELFYYVKHLAAPEYIDDKEIGEKIMDIYDMAHAVALSYMKNAEGKE